VTAGCATSSGSMSRTKPPRASRSPTRCANSMTPRKAKSPRTTEATSSTACATCGCSSRKSRNISLRSRIVAPASLTRRTAPRELLRRHLRAPDGTWDGEAVTRFAANQRDCQPGWRAAHPEARPVMRLHKGDLLRLEHRGKPEIMVCTGSTPPAAVSSSRLTTNRKP